MDPNIIRQLLMNPGPALSGLPSGGGISAPMPQSGQGQLSPLMAPPPQHNQGTPHIAPAPPVTPMQQQQDPMAGMNGALFGGGQGGQQGQGGLLGKLFPQSVNAPSMSPQMPMPLPTMGQIAAPSMQTSGGANITGSPMQMPTDISMMQPNLTDQSLLSRLGSLFGR